MRRAAISYIRRHVAAGTEIMADEANSWNDLHAHYEVKRINHQLGYSMDGACTNAAEGFFSRLHRAEVGSITTSPELTWLATRRRAHGVRDTAAPTTGRRRRAW